MPARVALRSLTLVLGAVLGTGPVAAQAGGGAVAHAATAARGFWQEAGERLARGDSLGALAALDSAVAVWPGQSAYPRAAARLAARLGLADRALVALERLTVLGAAWSASDPAFPRIVDDPRFPAALERNRAATAFLTRSDVIWALGDTTLLLEGVAVDAGSGRLFVSSVRGGRVLVRDPGGEVREFITPGDHGAGAILGMAVDRRRGLLWVTSADTVPGADAYPQFDGHSALYAFDLSTGKFRARVDLPPSVGGRQLGDIVITPRGTLFASDSRAPRVYRIGAGPIPPVAEVVVGGDPAFRNLQGMVASPDERVLYLADYTHGLLRVDLHTGAVRPIAPPPGETLLGIDGMATGGTRRLLAVQNGLSPARVIALHLDRAGTRVERIEVVDRPPLAPGEATLAVRSGPDLLYVGTRPGALRRLRVDP